jgi:predicted RNA binding protein YcfA (HicA-like mRNA interferase family)
MTKRDKRLEAMKNNPVGVRPQELENLLLGFGFVKRSGKGDHRWYTKGVHIVGVDFGKTPCKPVYVREAVIAIESALRESEDT